MNTQSKKYICLGERNDGLGSQYQSIIFTILYAEFNNFQYVHRNIKRWNIIIIMIMILSKKSIIS